MELIYLIGIVTALITAILWGLASIIIKKALIARVDPPYINAVRAPTAFAFMLLVVYFLGQFQALFVLTPTDLLIIGIATFFALAIGDTMYFYGLKHVGVAIGVPIAYIYPLYTLILASVVLGETVTVSLIIGTIVTVLGIFLITYKQNRQQNNNVSSNNSTKQVIDFKKGLPALFIGSLSWSVGIIIFKIALFTTPPLIVTAVRLGYLFLFMSPLFVVKQNIIRSFSKRQVTIVTIAGIIGITLGGLAFYISLDILGAARTTPITAVSPMFAALFAWAILKERIRMSQAIGILLTITGIWIVTLF